MIDRLIRTTPPAVDGDAMDPDALRALVDGLAAAPELWSPRVRHDPGERLFERLWRDERVEVWLICWSGEDHDTASTTTTSRTGRSRSSGAAWSRSGSS